MVFRNLWRRFHRPAHPLRAVVGEESYVQPALSVLEDKIAHRFEKPALLRQALMHRSHELVARRHVAESNERLEFLGDAVLGLIVNDYLYESYPTASEGGLTKMKSLLVCGERLAEVAGRFDLGAHIFMSRSEADTGGRTRASILADATEALIGAVYLDGGLPGARRVIQSWLLADCEQVLLSRGLENFKSRLQEIIQGRYKSPPRYRVISSEGPDHARVFRVSVTFNGRLLGQGIGASKKIAEQDAARQALAELAARDDLLEEIVEPADD